MIPINAAKPALYCRNMHYTARYYVQVEMDLVVKFMLISAAMTQSSFAWQSFIPSGPFAIFGLIEHLKNF